MGIHGLTGFIDRNQHLLHQHQLHDCSVVLDGNNFYHFLYYACHVQCSFGGDYDVYRRKIISTFQSFKRCGITAYVVMDGAYTRDGRKLKTSLSRATARIRLVNMMAQNQRGQALPALAYETFMQTLTEIGVPHATCQFEADVEIAVLANKLKCPVISNDSDFFIFDLSHGFLPLDYLDFRPLHKEDSLESESYHYLHCHKYHVDDFIKSFDGLNRSVLPVFASLLGNDFISASAFESFYSRVKVPKVVSKKFSLPPKLEKVISVLHWLHIHDGSSDLSAIKEELISFIKPCRKRRIERMFLSSINGYVDVDNFNGFDLYNFFTGSQENESYIIPNEDFRRYNGAPFPHWFIEAVCHGEITPSTLNVAILHRVIIITQVEDLSAPASYLCSANLRNVLYAILLQDDPAQVLNFYDPLQVRSVSPSADLVENTKSLSNQSPEDLCYDDTLCEEPAQLLDCQDVEDTDDKELEIEEEVIVEETDIHSLGPAKIKEVCVEEYLRVKKHLQKCYINPEFAVGDSVIPSLTGLMSTSVAHRKMILTQALGVDNQFLDGFADSLQLFVSCLVFWARNANPQISVAHLECVLTGVIFIKVLCYLKEKRMKPGRKQKNEEAQVDEHNLDVDMVESQENTLDIDRVCRETSVDVMENMRLSLDKYYKRCPAFNNKNHFEPRVCHAFAQMQACILDAINLNKVLRFPFSKLLPAELVNGTLLYNLAIELRVRPSPELFLATKLGNNSSFLKLYQMLKTRLVTYIGLDYFDPVALGTRTKSKRQKSKKKNKAKEEADSKTEVSDEDSSFETVAGFDVNNKFSLLCMVD
ncbi:unnamed protein product [Lymnaea stagnalis]|uniref:Asteroid domain-containing protein n=1 Tax=Lymnaea stagnalis TaxID=6523 RepID=A0AAV2GZS6_LYMST